MIKSVKEFPFSFLKIIIIIKILHKNQTPGINMQNGRQVFRVLGTYNFSIYANATMYIHMIDRIKSKSEFGSI